MQRRTQEMIAFLTPELKICLHQIMDEVDEYVLLHQEALLDEFQQAIALCTQQAKRAIEQGHKGQVQVLEISILLSSLLTERNDVLLGMHDHRYPFDFEECTAYFSYQFFMDISKKYLMSLTRKLKKQFVRCMDYECAVVYRELEKLMSRVAIQVILSFFDTKEICRQIKHLQLTGIQLTAGYYRNQQVPIKKL